MTTKMPDEIWADRFYLKINKLKNGCWQWLGYKFENGYGGFFLYGRMIGAHRASYILHTGKIKKGLVIHHKCNKRYCVNPDHLEMTTQKNNTNYGEGFSGLNHRKTHCSNGHALKGKNIKTVVRADGTRRKCKVCDRMLLRKKRSELYPNRKPRPKRMVNHVER